MYPIASVLYYLLYGVVVVTLTMIFCALIGVTAGSRKLLANTLLCLFEVCRCETGGIHSARGLTLFFRQRQMTTRKRGRALARGSTPWTVRVTTRRMCATGTTVGVGQCLPSSTGFLVSEIIVPRWKLEMEQKLQTGSKPVPFEESLKGDDGLRTVKVIVNDTLELISAGVESIIEDEVTPRFRAAEFPKWNCLTRYRDQYSHTK